jgi:hypothetical protein
MIFSLKALFYGDPESPATRVYRHEMNNATRFAVS